MREDGKASQTQPKADLRADLAREGAALASGLRALGRRTGQPEMASGLSFSPSALVQVSEPETVRRLTRILERARANQPLAAEKLGVTEARLSTFEAGIARFASLIGQPGAELAARSADTERLEAVMDRLSDLGDDLDDLLLSLTGTPFSVAYRAARSLRG